MRLFRDIGKLSPKYIPSRLPQREEDILFLFLPITVQVIGPAGLVYLLMLVRFY